MQTIIFEPILILILLILLIIVLIIYSWDTTNKRSIRELSYIKDLRIFLENHQELNIIHSELMKTDSIIEISKFNEKDIKNFLEFIMNIIIDVNSKIIKKEMIWYHFGNTFFNIDQNEKLKSMLVESKTNEILFDFFIKEFKITEKLIKNSLKHKSPSLKHQISFRKVF